MKTHTNRSGWARQYAIAAVILGLGAGLAWGQNPSSPINLEAPARSGHKVWHPRPAPAEAPIEAARVRIVDFGNDFLRGGDGAPRHHFHCHRYTLVQNKETGLWEPVSKPVALDHSVEVDGDGKLDDVVAYHEFSLTRPFNPVAPWYDTLAGTPRWYGGQAIYQANTTTSGFSEDGVNQDHDGQFAWPRENWAVFHETYETYCPYRVAANWLWLKHDFLGGGAAGKVTFDEQSRLALLLKRYFMGVDSVRFLVRDGAQCYLSEALFRYVGTHTLNPTRTRWARYAPQAPHDIYFDPARAEFAPHQFKDVTGVGVYCAKDHFLPAYFGYKWYSFECDAVVQRPKRPSENLNMAQVDGGPGVGAFHIGTTEVPYELWKNIFRQARSNNFVPPSQGFGFEKDGDMGSMDFGRQPHSLQEPATDFTLHDAAAWCNAISELESRTPAYYEDPEFKRPLHEVRISPAFCKPHPLPKLHVKWDADGYRLPTPSEWQAALAGQKPSPQTAVLGDNSQGKTQPVGTKAANGNGLYDMLGNVWELVWTFGDCYAPQQSPPITALGGDFLWPSEPHRRSANPYGDRPYEGSFSIGMRIVRRDAGAKAPAEASPAGDVPTWVIAKDLIAGPGATSAKPDVKLGLVAVPGVEVEMAAHETTFALWKQVRDWAVAHGYQTDYDGDMGSMDYWGFDPVAGRAEPPQTHWPDEPATDITFHDMAVWCNALSEMLGRKPVYYTDEDLKHVYQQAVKYRPVQFHFPEDFIDKYGKPETEDTRAVPMGAGASAAPPGAFHADAQERVLPSVYQNPSADGFRLPSFDEFQQAALPGKQKYPWGDDPKGVYESAWFFDNAGGTTHPVAQKKPTALGLYDIFGNACELSGAIPQGEKRPLRLGGSVLDLTIGEAGGRRNSDAPPPTWPYCDTGFRVVRQVAKTAAVRSGDFSLVSTADPREERPVRQSNGQEAGEARTRLAIDPSKFDALEGKVHRGNLYRNGDFQAKGVPANPAIQWSFKTGAPIKSSPVVVDGIACFGSWDGHVYAVDAASGRLLWKHKTEDRVTGSAAVVDGVVYIASEDGCLHALGARDGTLKWKTRCGARMAGSPAVAYGVVFIYGGTRTGSDGGTMSAGPAVGLDAKTGRQVWQSAADGGEYLSAVCLDATRMYHGIPNGASYHVVDLATGEAVVKAPAGWTHQNRPLTGMVRWEHLVVVPGSMKGSLCVWDLSLRNRELWKVPLSGEEMEVNNGGLCGYEILATPAVSKGRLLAGCNDGRVHAFDVRTGKPLWKFQTNGPVQSSPSVAGETAYFGSWDGHLYAVGTADGKLRWKLQLGDMPQTPAQQYKFASAEGGRIVSSPWPGDGVIYVGCDDGNLYAIEGR